MAKKTRREKHIHSHSIPLGQPAPSTVSISLKDLKIVISLSAILLISLIVYIPVFTSGFVWDDISYIENNHLVRSFNLQGIFSQYVMGNYHPFTVLMLAMEYQLFGLNASGYHIINLLFHLANVLLVYHFILLIANQRNVALIAAALFGLHPLHTESVAWISEIKDLLYTFFFLLASIYYLKYLRKGEPKFYRITLLFFLCSLLSKAMAASFPVVMVLIDYIMNKKMDMKIWIRKIPFFLLAIVFGVIAIFAQQSSEAIQDISSYSIWQRILFACYGYISYLWKMILPINQSAFYPYPIQSGESPGAVYYIFPVLVFAMVILAFYSLRLTKKIIFGLGYFTITVVLVLQLLPVGQAVMADRYTYIPSIGIVYLAAEGIYWLWTKKGKVPAFGLLSLFVIFFTVLTYTRNRVWKNGITLWTDVINKFPNVATDYDNRGGIYLGEKKFGPALVDLNKALQLSPRDAEALTNRAVLLSNKNKNEEALIDLNKAIELNPDYAYALSNRGIVLMELNRYAEALSDLNKAIALRPTYAEAYYNRGLLYMDEKKNELAVKDYDMALKLKPGYPEAIVNRGIILNEDMSSEKSLDNYDRAIANSPNNPQLYYNRGLVNMNLKRNAEATSDFNRAIELKPDYAAAFLNRGNIFAMEKNIVSAMADYAKAIELDPESAAAYVARGNLLRDDNKHEDALRDYNNAVIVDPFFANAYYNRGVLLVKEKRFQGVIVDFTKVLELKGDSAMAYYNIGMAELLLNRKDIACNNLRMAAGFNFQAAIDAQKQFCQ